MRVLMPLFHFQYCEDQEFAFSDGRFFIRGFDNAKHLADREIFSKQDRDRMDQQARHALVAESDDLTGYKLDASLLLMTCRILSDHRTPIIKYRLSEEESLCGRIEDTEVHILLPGYLYQVYSMQDFPRLDAVYMGLRQAEPTTVRLKNAFYFLFRAFNSYQWIDAFLFYMNTLEALFSLDRKGPASKTICRRVSRLLDDPSTWPEQSVADLYDVRSRMTHGKLEARNNSTDNLRLLEKMERLTKMCFRRLITLNAFQQFASSSARDQFLKPFD